MILEGDFGVIGDGLKDAVDKIFESSKTLATVVDDYLNISRIELGTMKYNFVPLDLRELTETVIGELKPNFEKAGVSWKFECDASKKYIVKADPDKLKQVIANIVDNSMKYSPKGNAVISVTRDETRHIAQFKISDNGIGMSTVTLAKLFNKFTRADNANQTNIRGTGLGLYVARDVIGAHKGKIWAESDGEGKGSRFIFELALI
jgi:signal transduction histidine kinase